MNARLSLARRRADRAADSVIDAGIGQQNKMEWNLSDLTEVLGPLAHRWVHWAPSALPTRWSRNGGSLGQRMVPDAVEKWIVALPAW